MLRYVVIPSAADTAPRRRSAAPLSGTFVPRARTLAAADEAEESAPSRRPRITASAPSFLLRRRNVMPDDEAGFEFLAPHRSASFLPAPPPPPPPQQGIPNDGWVAGSRPRGWVAGTRPRGWVAGPH